MRSEAYVLHVMMIRLHLEEYVLVRFIIVKLALPLNACNVIKVITGIQMQIHQYVPHVLILNVLLVQVILAHHAKQDTMILVIVYLVMLLAAMIV